MTRILVFQHHPLEHPGTLRDFLAADGVRWDTVHLDAGDKIPALDRYDALIVMGGPQDVWEENRYPWLVDEKAAIRTAVVQRKMAFLGICLGHQLLATALGGKVELMKGRSEIGVCQVELTAEGERDLVLGGANRVGASRSLWCLQWHGAEVTALPAGAVRLAHNATSLIQAFRYGTRAYGLQFHVEATKTTVPEWAAIAAYKQALERGLGPGELPAFEAEARQRAGEFRASAKRLYSHFKSLIAAQ